MSARVTTPVSAAPATPPAARERRLRPFRELVTDAAALGRQHPNPVPTNRLITDVRGTSFRYWSDGSLRRVR